jgi:hypothetical protein
MIRIWAAALVLLFGSGSIEHTSASGFAAGQKNYNGNDLFADLPPDSANVSRHFLKTRMSPTVKTGGRRPDTVAPSYLLLN